MNKYVESALSLFSDMAKGFNPEMENHVYIAGGIAVAWWLENSRVTHDVDAVFTGEALPEKVFPLRNNLVFLDLNYNDTFSLVHEDYYDRAPEVAVYGSLHIHMTAPVDLAIMKLSRASPKDMNDIDELFNAGLIDRKEFEKLAEEAMQIYIGNVDFIRLTLEKVLEKHASPSFEPRA